MTSGATGGRMLGVSTVGKASGTRRRVHPHGFVRAARRLAVAATAIALAVPAEVLAAPIVLEPGTTVISPEQFEGDDIDGSSALVGGGVGVLAGVGLAGAAMGAAALRRQRLYHEMQEERTRRFQHMVEAYEDRLRNELERSRSERSRTSATILQVMREEREVVESLREELDRLRGQLAGVTPDRADEFAGGRS